MLFCSTYIGGTWVPFGSNTEVLFFMRCHDVGGLTVGPALLLNSWRPRSKRRQVTQAFRLKEDDQLFPSITTSGQTKSQRCYKGFFKRTFEWDLISGKRSDMTLFPQSKRMEILKNKLSPLPPASWDLVKLLVVLNSAATDLVDFRIQ